MKEKRFYFRTMLEAMANAERIKNEHYCDNMKSQHLADGRAVLILLVDEEEGAEHEES